MSIFDMLNLYYQNVVPEKPGRQAMTTRARRANSSWPWD